MQVLLISETLTFSPSFQKHWGSE